MRLKTWHLRALVVHMVPLLGWTAEARSADISVVLTDADIYKQMASAIQGRLEAAGHSCDVVKIPREVESEAVETAPARDYRPHSPETGRVLDALGETHAAVLVTVGSNATSLTLEANSETPIVYCLVPNALDRSFVTEENVHHRLAGLTTDISPDDQIRWIKKLSPRVETLGILYSERSRRTVEAIARAAERKHVRVEAIVATKDQFGKAVQALSDRGCDGALMIADAEVYDSTNAQSLLLWGLRGQKPVWAFSANLVKAGAFAGLYVDYSSMADQTVKTVKRILDGETPSKIGLVYPARPRAALNERTSEMIGVSIGRDALESLAMRFGKQ